MKDALLHALKTIYAPVPAALANDAEMILVFLLVATGFYFLYEPGRRFSPRAAFAYVFRRDLFLHKTSWVDILHFFMTVAFWIPVVGAFVTLYLTTDMSRLLAAWFGPRPALMQAGWALAVLQFLVIFVSRDFGSYIAHYILHRVPLLWSIHRTHHSAEVLTFFTSARVHPLEYLHMQAFIALFGGLGGGIVLYLTGTTLQAAPIVLLLATGFFFETFGLAQHSHVRISFGRLNNIFFAPILHQLHHSAEPRHRDKNSGSQLSIFDWLFGTLYVPEKGENYRWGLNEDELGENNPHLKLKHFYLEPFAHAFRLLMARNGAKLRRESIVEAQPSYE